MGNRDSCSVLMLSENTKILEFNPIYYFWEWECSTIHFFFFFFFFFKYKKKLLTKLT